MAQPPPSRSSVQAGFSLISEALLANKPGNGVVLRTLSMHLLTPGPIGHPHHFAILLRSELFVFA